MNKNSLILKFSNYFFYNVNLRRTNRNANCKTNLYWLYLSNSFKKFQSLKMKEKDRNIAWFKNQGKRKDLIIKFYCELEDIGINDDIGLRSDSHWDDFKFRFDDTELIIQDKKILQKVYELASKYEKLINTTCENCGNRINNSGSDYFCEECCFHSILKKESYDYISDLGFSYFDNNIASENPKKVFVRWNIFSKAIFIINEESIFSSNFPCEIYFQYKKPLLALDVWDEICIQETLSIFARNENFYTLLKHIPNNLLNENDQKIKNDLINHLDDCNICGHKSIYNKNNCLVCHSAGYNRVLTERMKKYYNTIEEWYKKMQLDYHSEDSEFKYPRLENQFEKSENEIKLFTEKELDDLKLLRSKKYNL